MEDPYAKIMGMLIVKRIQGPATRLNLEEFTVRVPKKKMAAANADSLVAHQHHQALNAEESKTGCQEDTPMESETESEVDDEDDEDARVDAAESEVDDEDDAEKVRVKEILDKQI